MLTIMNREHKVKQWRKFMLNSLRFFAFLLCFLVTAQQTCAEGNKDEEKELYRVIFSTFEDRSAGKYQYLTDSVQAMLASRLAAGEKIVVLDKSLSKKQLEFLKKDNKEKALVVDQGLQVDYLISGALYELNSGLNIQLTVYPLASDGEMLRFSTVTDADTSLIADVEVLSIKIARDAFGQDVGGGG